MGKKLVAANAQMRRRALRKAHDYFRSRSNAFQAMDGWDGVGEVRSRLQDAGLTTAGPFHKNGNSFLEVPLWVHVAAFENKKDRIVDFVWVSVAKNEIGVTICAPNLFHGGQELAGDLLEMTNEGEFSGININCVAKIGVVYPSIHLPSVSATPKAVATAVSDLVAWICTIGVGAMQMRASLQGLRDYVEELEGDGDRARSGFNAVANEIESGEYFAHWEQSALLAMNPLNILIKCGCLKMLSQTFGWVNQPMEVNCEPESGCDLQTA